MKITKMKLVNFIGIDHGMGLGSIEIDFTNDKEIILFNGANGSGKSTIMSHLHPYKQTFDERRYFILPGKEGIKEITIDDGETEYFIKHIYKPGKDDKHTTSSYIQKNGVELNEAGLNSTFEEELTKELDITPDYFKISKIGSNTKTFTQLTVGERKNFIAGFLNMEELSLKYGIIDKKVKAMKKDISTLNDNISKYQDIDILKTSIDDAEKYLNSADLRIKTLYENHGNINANIKTLDSKLSTYNILDLTNRERALTDKLLNSFKKEDVEAIYNKDINLVTLDDLQNDLPEKKDALIKINSELYSKETIRKSVEDNKNAVSKTIEEIENEIRGLSSNIDLNKLKTELLEYQTELSELTITEAHKDLIKELDIISQINKMEQFVSSVQRNLDNVLSFKAASIENIFNNALVTILNSHKSTINKSIVDLNTNLGGLKSERDFLIKNSERYKKLLDMRPSNCVIDTCPFIKEATENKEKIEGLPELENKIDTIINEIQKKESIIERLDEVMIGQADLYNKCSNVCETMLFNYIETNYSLSTLDAQQYFNNFQALKAQINNDIYNANRIKILTEKSSKLQSTIDHETEKLNIINNNYMKSLVENQTKLADITAKLKTLNDDVTILTNSQKRLTAEISVISGYIDYLVNYNTIQKELDDVKLDKSVFYDLSNQRTDWIKQQTDYNTERISLETEVKNKKSLIENNKSQLSVLTNIHESLKALNEKYIPMTNIALSLNPTKGIPLVLMKVYLQATENVANELLNIAFEGMFKIKFITNEKDFFIQVIKNDGSIKEDVKLVSQGEMSLIETSLSLALMGQNMTKFNILTLDEIDGPLDSTNRRRFVNIIKAQMLELGCNQVFIISHNDEFDSEDVSIIELRKGGIVRN